MRIENNGTRYFGLTELAKAYNVKPAEMPIEKKNNLVKNFQTKHVCKACKQPLVLSSGNILVCNNPECRGIKITRKAKDGTEYDTYEPSYEILDEVGEKIAERIFEC